MSLIYSELLDFPRFSL